MPVLSHQRVIWIRKFENSINLAGTTQYKSVFKRFIRYQMPNLEPTKPVQQRSSNLYKLEDISQEVLNFTSIFRKIRHCPSICPSASAQYRSGRALSSQVLMRLRIFLPAATNQDSWAVVMPATLLISPFMEKRPNIFVGNVINTISATPDFLLKIESRHTFPPLGNTIMQIFLASFYIKHGSFIVGIYR